MRRVIAFPSDGETLVGTLDLPEQPAQAGVLIVSGGNEVRHGAHRGMAMLAQDLAAGGLAAFRFDRAGIGDSTGENMGYAGSQRDIAAASAVLRREAKIEITVGFGNCDAAAALALNWGQVGVETAIFANPWLGDEPDALPPPAAIRARYAERLLSPAAWSRLLTGKANLHKLAGGLGKIARPSPPADMAARVIKGIDDWGNEAAVVLATHDATAIAFAATGRATPVRTYEIDTASHSFAGEESRRQLVRIIREEADRLKAAFEQLETKGYY